MHHIIFLRKVSASRWHLFCTSTQLSSATIYVRMHIYYKLPNHIRDLPIKIQFQTPWPHPGICVTKETRLAPPAYKTFGQWRDVTSRGDVTQRPSVFIMHTAHGGTDLGALACKVSPAGWDLALEDGIISEAHRCVSDHMHQSPCSSSE